MTCYFPEVALKGHVMLFATILKSWSSSSHQVNSKSNIGSDMVCKTLLKHWNCVLSCQRWIGHGLKLEKVGPLFSRITAQAAQTHVTRKECKVIYLQ